MRLRCMIVGLFMVASMTLTGCGGGPGLNSIQLIPGSQSLNSAGETAQFQAIGHYSKKNGTSSTQDLTSQVTWASSNKSVATVSSAGLVTAVATGTTTITATMTSGFGPVTGQATVTVSIATGPGPGTAVRQLVSLTIIPSSQTLTAANQQAQFLAIGTFNLSPTTQDLTNQVTWRSSLASVATIDPSSGIATAKDTGTTTITATSQGTNLSGVGTATLTVSGIPAPRAIVSVSVLPTAATLTAPGQTVQFKAIGTFNNGQPTTQDITSGVVWSSSQPQIASINASSGLATAGNVFGTTTITATWQGAVVGTATVTVQQGGPAPARQLISISIVPTNQTVKTAGETGQFIAIGTFNTPSATGALTEDVSSSVVWSSSDVFVATIDQTGLAVSQNLGTTTIVAKYTDPVTGATIAGVATFTFQP